MNLKKNTNDYMSFNDFLNLYYNTNVNAWRCIYEPLKTLIHDSYHEYIQSGTLNLVSYVPKSLNYKNRGNKDFSEWLRKRMKISWDCFLSQPLTLKTQIYNQYWSDCIGKK